MALRPPSRPGHPYLAGAPLLIAHRGGSLVAPENTMEAFRRAVEDWEADMLELDVHLTRDGEVVVLHDPTFDRTCDRGGAVAECNWEEVRARDAGHHFRGPDGDFPFRGRGVYVPRLAEVLDAFPGTRINVELKDAASAGPVVELVRRRGAEHRVLVASAEEGHRTAARGYRGPWGASRRQIAAFWALHRLPSSPLHTPGVDALQVPEVWRGLRIVTPRLVEEAHRRNIAVHVWTVDREADMRRLLAWGVDGIMSDRPDLLARVLVEVAGRPPPPAMAAAPAPP